MYLLFILLFTIIFYAILCLNSLVPAFLHLLLHLFIPFHSFTSLSFLPFIFSSLPCTFFPARVKGINLFIINYHTSLFLFFLSTCLPFFPLIPPLRYIFYHPALVTSIPFFIIITLIHSSFTHPRLHTIFSPYSISSFHFFLTRQESQAFIINFHTPLFLFYLSTSLPFFPHIPPLRSIFSHPARVTSTASKHSLVLLCLAEQLRVTAKFSYIIF